MPGNDVGWLHWTTGWLVTVGSRALVLWITGLLSGAAPTWWKWTAFILLEQAPLFCPGIYTGAYVRLDSRDLALTRLQVRATSLVKMSYQGNRHSDDYQTESLVYNIETTACRCLIQTWIWIIVPQELQSHFSCPPSLYVFMSLSVGMLCLLLMCLCDLPSSRSPWWRGGGVDQVLPIQALNEVAWCPPGTILFTFVLQSTFLSSNCIHCDIIVVFVLFSAHSTSIAFLFVLGKGSLLCCSSWWFLPVFGVGVFPHPSRGSEDRGCHMLYRL